MWGFLGCSNGQMTGNCQGALLWILAYSRAPKEVCGMTEGVLEADRDGNHGQAEITHTCLEAVRFLLLVRVTVFTWHCITQLA